MTDVPMQHDRRFKNHLMLYFVANGDTCFCQDSVEKMNANARHFFVPFAPAGNAMVFESKTESECFT